MERYICIHGHFYQPPRENPWLEDVELQDSAYPYHDWNTRITEECYKQNAASRILGPDRKIIDIVNNYSTISFNFGPTLLSWLQEHAPEVYESVIEADKQSMNTFGGHGAAIAQAYNHMIMPLANSRDKLTQVIWGIRDFEHRFGRKPEGMWLPETAVDLATLDVLAENGIKFTILAPHQAKRVRQIGQEQWQDVDKAKLDTTQPYVCRLKSGREITLFFYQGPIAVDVANGKLLQNGETLAKKLCEVFTDKGQPAQLVHIADDGETYGHHHRYTDMALAYCLHYLESNGLAKITIYGQYLEAFPPTHEVEINENTSWSCTHGIERWKSNCGCNHGRYPSGLQQWREPLREAMDWLRDRLAETYETNMAGYVDDPWKLRNDYISVVLDRSRENAERFLSDSTKRKLDNNDKIIVLKLLEMQRFSMLMYTSCGWFFDDISGIEAVQIMQYACRAMQLANEVTGIELEEEYQKILEKAQTNLKQFANGRQVYDELVRPDRVDLNRVGAHFAVSSLFTDYKDKADIFCYTTTIEAYERIDAGIHTLAIGRAGIESNIIWEKHLFDFAVLHFGEQNLIAAVDARMPDEKFTTVHESMKSAFLRGDTAETMRLMNVNFSGNNYSLWHLFKEQQRSLLRNLLQTQWQEIDALLRHIYEHNYTIMQMMRSMNMPLPKPLVAAAEFVLNEEFSRVIRADQINTGKLSRIKDEAQRLSLEMDEPALRLAVSHRIDNLMERLENSPFDTELLRTIDELFKVLQGTVTELDLQKSQNVFFAISREKRKEMKDKAKSGDSAAKLWLELFENLAGYLDVAIP